MVSYFLKVGNDLARLSPRIKQFFVRLTFMSLTFELIKLVPPLLFKGIIDRLVVYDPAVGLTFELVLFLIAGYAGAMLLMTVFDVILQRILDYNIRDAEVDVAQRTLRKLLALDVTYHESNETGASVNKIIKGQGKLFDVLYNTMYLLFPVFFQAMFTGILLIYFGWQIGLLFIIVLPLFVIIMLRGAEETQESREEYHAHYDRFAGATVQSVSNIRTVKDFDNEGIEYSKADTHLQAYRAAITKRVRIGLKHMAAQQILTDTARVLTLVLAVWLLIKGTITTGSLVLIMTLSEKSYLNLHRLYRVYYTMQDAEPSIKRLGEIYDAKLTVLDTQSDHKVTAGRVEFKDVTFKYSPGGQDALKAVSFTVEPKSTVALVGRSGSGKSTLVKLLMRHADPASGAILVDGVPSNEYSFKNLRGAMAVVSQDVELFNATIHDNIAYGLPDASREEVIAAARLAHAHEFIERFEKGYDTMVGERGVKLSGGQKQRVAIARALLRKPKILIFDEATSSLDAESEQMIHKAIFGMSGKLTLIIIAHRFATIEHADKVILLEQGEVRETGTHRELMRKKGIFSKLRKLQQLGEVD
jgi:ABC-type multidrug transport system fused ATPase/permease subunit